MLSHFKCILLKLHAVVRRLVHIVLTAFPPHVPAWTSEQLTELPSCQGLLTPLDLWGFDSLRSEVLLVDIEPLRPAYTVNDREQYMFIDKTDASSVEEDRSVVAYLTLREMWERYRRASNQAMLHAKQSQD